jgi:dihydrodiol dehydrogenase / D-xylose 1-dehydrogenase (NADP)
VAVAARSPAKAYEFATMHSIPTYHTSYQELISNPNIDIIYIATIADHHYELAKQSILAGKHALVEKPMTLCYNHTKELIELATKQSTTSNKNVFLMEGMWTRCFPAMHKLRQLVISEEVGQIVYVQGDFGYEFPNNGYSPTTNNDRIWYPNSGGIALDVGMYIAQLGRIAFPNGKVKDVQAVGTMKNGVDFTVMANVTYDRSSLQYCKNTRYNSGSDDRCNNTTSSNSSRDSSRDHLLPSEEDTVEGMLQMVLTGASNTEERCVLQGTKGRIILDGPFHVPQ